MKEDKIHEVKRERLAPNQRRFLAAFSIMAHFAKAAKTAGVARSSHYNWMRQARYAEAFESAHALGMQALEDEAVRRAQEGVRKPVFYQGVAVMVPVLYPSGKPVLDAEDKPLYKPYIEHEFSDTLMIQLLKANLPEKYKDRATTELSGLQGKPILFAQSKTLAELLEPEELERLKIRLMAKEGE